MTRRVALLYLALASPLVLVSFCLRGPAGEYLFTVLAMGYPVALVALAIARNGRAGSLAAPLAVLLILLELCALAMLFLRGQVADGPWIGGLPLAASIQLYGLWLLPLLLVPLAYALTFDSCEMRDEDLDRLERFRRENAGKP